MELSVSAIRELIRLTDPVAIHASLRAHPDDDMLAFSRAAARSDPLGTMAYFRAGMQIVDVVVARIADWRFGGLDKVGSFLDFARRLRP